MDITPCDASQVRIVTVQAQPSDQTRSYLLRPWRDQAPLRGTFITRAERPIFHYPGLEKPLDQPQKVRVGDSMLQEANHVGMSHMIEGLHDTLPITTA